DDDDGPSDDDDNDTDDEDEEPFKDEDDDEEEEEHLAPTDSFVVLVVDHVPSTGDTEAFETDESAPTPRSPQTKVPFTQTRLRRARKTVRLELPMSPSMEARIAEYAAAPTSPSPPPSPISPWSPTLSLLFQSVDGLVEDRQFHYKTAQLTHTQMQDYCIASQESLMKTLIAHVSSLQVQLSAALGQIQALQARDQTHADDPEGAGSSA
ncbi:hypothetical protein Tco_1371683, partial [Tanacetum coccineum]